ncbi:response regulator [Pseudozobellia thermophila]|uniref:Response regulator receiver domain-containing protein n=1 Tax=Pseudozobellia thermophila TaxID=192903 RepID=A0A1M6FP63_9FLAO|nr:response regulator [Pseudozobellia thermophila]SHI99455.1 Response regulator receiver domain-containing protein [Pseudozobellia thermophila]
MKPTVHSELVVWVIDDDFVSLFATRYGIEQWNRKCRVVDFDNAETALKIFSDTLEEGGEKPDVILLDLIMPDMDGWTFLSKFEEMYDGTSGTDVYILSAFTNSKDRKRAKEHPSVKGHFDKPLSKHLLEEVFTKNYS